MVAVNNAGEALRESWAEPRWLAVFIAVPLALLYGYQVLRHRWAVSRIDARLRGPALAARNRPGRTWLLVVALVAAALAVPAVAGGDPALLGVLLVIAGAALFARDHLRPGTEPSDRELLRQGLGTAARGGRAAGRSVADQVSRWRFR